MKVSHQTLAAASIGVLLYGAVAAQQNAGPPQSAPALAAIGPARPNRGNLVDKPAGAMPTVPPGFTVQVYAELQAPRMMVYAPNGDLFISSPAANNITVLRDVGQDGVFETRSVYAQGEAPAGRGAGGGPAAQPVVPGPQTPVNPLVNGPILGASAPACAAPPAFANRGPGTLAAPFGLAFQGEYLYVGEHGLTRALQVHARRPQGAGTAGEAARPSRGRSLDAEHRLQPSRHQDVPRGRVAVEQHRGRRLPACRDPGIQSRRLGVPGVCVGHP